MQRRLRSELCEFCAPKLHSDGYPILKLGRWSRNKLFHLKYYASLFSTGMKGRWSRRAYLDFFAGPGLCLFQNIVDDGSPLAALKQEDPFTHYAFVDSDLTHIEALEKRSIGLATGSAKLTLLGNCNDSAILKKVLDFVPEQALCLMFVDPFKWDIDFETIREVTGARRTDIILVFHIGSMKRVIGSGNRSPDRFFGDQGEWYHIYQSVLPSGRTRALLDYFKHRLSTLGYQEGHFPSEVPVLNTKNVPLYYLIFASKHPRGQEFWRKSIQRTVDGGRRLPGF